MLKESSFIIQPEDRIGLIGKNGAGKTTLLKLIAGLTEPTSGTVNIPKETTIGYLPQEMKIVDKTTLLEETMRAFEAILQIEKRLSQLNHAISQATDFHSEDYLKKLDQMAEFHERYSILGGDNYQAEIEKTLMGLGFERSDFHRPTSEFSGGWRMRVELAKLLLQKPDILLLDEPTNHLDIESIEWLEIFLKSYRGAVVLVSHDKAFLDTVCNRTLEIALGKLTDQQMNFSAFIEWKKEQREIQLAAYRNQQKMIADTEKFIERFRYKATKAVQVQSRIKQLEKLDRIEVEETDNSGLKIRFPDPPRSGRVVTEAKNITKSYGDHVVLDEIDLTVEKGEKIAFVGRNGEGKTTLVRILLNEIDFEGLLKEGHQVKTGYFAQDQAQRLNEALTVFETIDEIARGEVRTKIRDILGAFLFSGEDVDKKVQVLSGGEKSRLAMIRLLLEPVNLLVLDEPTNHLDMQSKEILKEALLHFSGTVIVVSHDRDFLDGLVDCVYEFRNRKIRQHLGGIFDFLRKKRMESLKELEVPAQKETGKQRPPKKGRDRVSEMSFEERKAISRNISRLEKKVAEHEAKIGELEKEIAAMDQILASSGVVSDSSVFKKYDQLKEALNECMELWEQEHEALEDWKSKKNGQ